MHMWGLMLAILVNGKVMDGDILNLASATVCEAARNDLTTEWSGPPARLYCKERDWALNNSGQPPLTYWPDPKTRELVVNVTMRHLERTARELAAHP
jgi:hypothetical protein